MVLQVQEAASIRSKSSAVQQAEAEAELVAKNEALKSLLDAQAQQLRQQQAANKKHLAVRCKMLEAAGM